MVPLTRALDTHFKSGEVEGFLKKRKRSCLDGLNSRLLVAMTGDDNRRHVKFRNHLEAVHLRHPQIANEDLGHELRLEAQGLRATRGDGHHMSSAFESAHENLADHVVVIDHQNTKEAR